MWVYFIFRHYSAAIPLPAVGHWDPDTGEWIHFKAVQLQILSTCSRIDQVLKSVILIKIVRLIRRYVVFNELDKFGIDRRDKWDLEGDLGFSSDF